MKRNKIIVIGSGRLGANIATTLSLLDEDVLILDKNETSFRKLSDEFSGYDVVGDATDLNVLENDAFIREAKEVVIVTNNDNINLFIALICFHVYDVPFIYARFSDTDKGRLVVNTTIHPIYPFTLSLEDYLSKRKKGDHS